MPLMKNAGAEAGKGAAETAGFLARHKVPIIGLGGVGLLAAGAGAYTRHKQRQREERVVNGMLNRGVPKYAEEADYIVMRHMEKDAFLKPLMAGIKALGTGIKTTFGANGGLKAGFKGMTGYLDKAGYGNAAANLNRWGKAAYNGGRNFITNARNMFRSPTGAATG